MHCSICGHPLPESSPGRGRPRMYHPTCRKIEQLFSWLEDLIIDLEVTTAKKKEIRSRFWSMANILNNNCKDIEKDPLEIPMKDKEITAMVLCGETHKKVGQTFGVPINRARQITCRTINKCKRSERITKELLNALNQTGSGINDYRRIAMLFLVILFEFSGKHFK